MALCSVMQRVWEGIKIHSVMLFSMMYRTNKIYPCDSVCLFLSCCCCPSLSVVSVSLCLYEKRAWRMLHGPSQRECQGPEGTVVIIVLLTNLAFVLSRADILRQGKNNFREKRLLRNLTCNSEIQTFSICFFSCFSCGPWGGFHHPCSLSELIMNTPRPQSEDFPVPQLLMIQRITQFPIITVISLSVLL